MSDFRVGIGESGVVTKQQACPQHASPCFTFSGGCRLLPQFSPVAPSSLDQTPPLFRNFSFGPLF